MAKELVLNNDQEGIREKEELPASLLDVKFYPKEIYAIHYKKEQFSLVPWDWQKVRDRGYNTWSTKNSQNLKG